MTENPDSLLCPKCDGTGIVYFGTPDWKGPSTPCDCGAGRENPDSKADRIRAIAVGVDCSGFYEMLHDIANELDAEDGEPPENPDSVKEEP